MSFLKKNGKKYQRHVQSAFQVSDPSLTPQVLTSASIQLLTTGFDASDTLECYLLTRDAFLYNVANSTIPVQKLALGLRFRPQHGLVKRWRSSFEMTLEYGSIRPVENLLQETVPMVVVTQNVIENTTSSSVEWKNDAKIYYTLRIDGYRSANYIASMTGAVLENLLQTAYAYPSQKHRRYQPFEVRRLNIENPASSGHLLLRSSSELDFMNTIWMHLTEVGVELKPVILPPRWRIQLFASGIRKVTSYTLENDEDRRSDEISVFYTKLYTCLQAIASATFELNDSPSSSATKHNESRLLSQKDAEPNEDIDDDTDLVTDVINNTFGPSDRPSTKQEIPQQQESNSNQIPPSIDTSQVAEDAQKAAEDAETAAHEAQNSGNEQAAQAAQAAADAAKKAAESTRDQAALVAQKALLSGDGDSMADSISLCLSAPRFGLARNDSNVTTVYLYYDGTVYYAVSLTAPYIRVVAETTQLPLPANQANQPLMIKDEGVDLVDWVIAGFVFLLFCFGFLCLIQKILGRKVQVIRPLYRFQQWFFDPIHYDYDSVDVFDTSERMEERRGKGLMYTFAEDVIPLSMGGRIGWSPNFTGGSASSESLQETVNSNNFELVSMAQEKKQSEELFRNNFRDSISLKTASLPSVSNILSASPSTGSLVRNPDFVALPDLKSSSRVAIPISLRSACNVSRKDSD